MSKKIYTHTYTLKIINFICVTGSKWRKRRKILTPAFHFTILKEFVDVFIEEGNRMTKYLKDIDGSNVDDLAMFISQHTLNAICGKYIYSRNKKIRSSINNQLNKFDHIITIT